MAFLVHRSAARRWIVAYLTRKARICINTKRSSNSLYSIFLGYRVKETLQIGRVKQFLCKKENTGCAHRLIVSDILIRCAASVILRPHYVIVII
jgi:hypothetical protein